MKLIIAKILLLLTIPMLLVSCFKPNVGSGNLTPGQIANRLTPDECKIADFADADGYPEGFWARNDRGNGPPFNCSFMRSNAVVDNARLTLSLTKSDTGFVGAEFRSGEVFSYGYYSVCMKAAKCDGVISSFFTYTGWP